MPWGPIHALTADLSIFTTHNENLVPCLLFQLKKGQYSIEKYIKKLDTQVRTITFGWLSNTCVGFVLCLSRIDVSYTPDSTSTCTQTFGQMYTGDGQAAVRKRCAPHRDTTLHRRFVAAKVDRQGGGEGLWGHTAPITAVHTSIFGCPRLVCYSVNQRHSSIPTPRLHPGLGESC